MDNFAVSTKCLSKSYTKGLYALDDITLQVDHGKVLVVMGPSGSGKSTLIRTFNGLEPFDAGEINILGVRIDSTYDKHYSHNKFQATEFIIDSGHGEGFCIGNILKYAQRYGKKNGKDRNDLLKVIHYGIIALHINEMEKSEK